MKKGARFLCYAQKDGIACEVCMEVRLTGANQGHMLACGPGADGNWAQEGLGDDSVPKKRQDWAQEGYEGVPVPKRWKGLGTGRAWRWLSAQKGKGLGTERR